MALATPSNERPQNLNGYTILPFVIRPAPACRGSVTGFPTSQLSPATTYVVLPKENHMQLTEAATLCRKSGGAEGSAVPRTFPGNAESRPVTNLSSRPERSGEICGFPLGIRMVLCLVSNIKEQLPPNHAPSLP